MRRSDFNECIDNGRFEQLFNVMGWNHPSNPSPVYISIDEVDFDLIPVAEKQGFQVFKCNVPTIPTASECKKIDNQLRKYAYDYICIFVESGSKHHLWLTPVKTNEKRELVKTEYLEGAKADFLFSKVDDMTFGLTERVLITDVKNRVQGVFQLNSEKVTKDFYTQFRKEHTAFKKYITGIDDTMADRDNKNKDWYASVMLNRLMFCYFIQKKGFLDLNPNYLQDKLRWVEEQQGKDRFYGSFYRSFLRALFHDGLNDPIHDTDAFRLKFGQIPYLNGGMFDRHQLECEYPDIEIADVAFENLFAFFDRWNWHLDTRLTASGHDINPDVLGYIFEQYINDRAAMGAYYTKEDITEYIGKNCIIPFLMDKTQEKSPSAFRPIGFVWSQLKESGDKYIYDAVKKGYTADWQDRIPAYISQGISLLPEQHDLLERRSRWNEKTFDEFALPTEIWRETIERLQRCESLQQKITGGEITQINDFITYNLDIRQFAEDIIRTTTDHQFVLHFYEALQHVTILDPTCGSGAFLFAALNILEPLYEACLDRMEDWHRENPRLFEDQLKEMTVKYSSNRQYFIYKSIILRNLYGVDIMQEATEIAKLRLFLKMMAVVDVDKRKDNMGLDPLPDIDFNIKCGNTLVGYATQAELDEALANGDMYANQEFKEKIKAEMEVVSKAYDSFCSEQLKTYDDNESIKETKEMLRARLAKLNTLLNQHMYKATTSRDVQNDKVDKWYDAWEKSHQPFHWLAEFYHIIKGNGGFDIIIGNPPYVSIKSISYINSKDNFKCSDLYGFVIKRVYYIMHSLSTHGFIVMHNLAFSSAFADVRKILRDNSNSIWCSFYSRIPSGLFSGDCRVRNTIYITSNRTTEKEIYTTRLHRWFAESRNYLFESIKYGKSYFKNNDVIPMSEYSDLLCVFDNKQGCSIKLLKDKYGKFPIYFKQTAYNWLPISITVPPSYDTNGTLKPELGAVSGFMVNNEFIQELLLLLFNGKFYFLKWMVYGDDFHLTQEVLTDFYFPVNEISQEDKRTISLLAAQFKSQIESHVQFKLNAGLNIGNYNTSKLWDITDKSDRVLLKYIVNDVESLYNHIDSFISKVVISEKIQIPLHE